MLECASINKNSKLYQKFLERKGKKEAQSSSPLCELNLDKERMPESTNESKKLQASMHNGSNGSRGEVNKDQDIKRSDYPTSQVEISNLDELLKKELSKSRGTSVSQESKIEPFQLYPQKGREVRQREMQLQLQNEHFASQNKRLKQKIAEQTQRYQIMRLSLEEQRQKSKQLEEDLLRAQEQINSFKCIEMKHAQSAIGSEQIDKLKEQNHLAKQYLYKLTVKLYQSQQQNQSLQKELDQIKGSLSIRTMQAVAPQQPMKKSVRKREFQYYRQDSKEKSSKKQPQAPSLPSSRLSSKEIRIVQIKSQLEQLNLLKVFNGKNRRRKIELQRQLQQLNLS